MKSNLLWLAVVALLMVGVPAVLQADAGDPLDPALSPAARLEALVEKVRTAQEGYRTLSARFVQRKESLLLLEPAESSGRFSYKAPDSVRWEYETPDPISMVIVGEVMTTWYRDLGKVDRVRVGKQSQRVLQYLGATSSLENLLEYFRVTLRRPEVEGAPFNLELTPAFARVAKRIRGMSLWIDTTTYLPVQLKFVEPDGDVTEYKFDQFEVNSTLPEDLFELHYPSDVEVRTINFEASGAPSG